MKMKYFYAILYIPIKYILCISYFISVWFLVPFWLILMLASIVFYVTLLPFWLIGKFTSNYDIYEWWLEILDTIQEAVTNPWDAFLNKLQNNKLISFLEDCENTLYKYLKDYFIKESKPSLSERQSQSSKRPMNSLNFVNKQENSRKEIIGDETNPERGVVSTGIPNNTFVLDKDTGNLESVRKISQTQNQNAIEKLENADNSLKYSLIHKEEEGINIDLSALEKKGKSKKVYKGDWDLLNSLKNSIGQFGEQIVLHEEAVRLNQMGFKNLKPFHASKEIGDGLGYDIISYNTNKEEIYLEVKSSTKNNHGSIGFTANEIKMMKQLQNKYYIKLVFNIDMNSNSYSIDTISAQDLLKLYTFVPTAFIAKKNKD